MVNPLINIAVQTSTWGEEFLTMNNAAEARLFLEVSSGGGSGGTNAVSSVNGKIGAVVLSASDVGAATAAQGAKADSALQPGDALGAISSVNGKTGTVVLGYGDVGAASAAQGAKADTAVQPADIKDSPVQSVNGKAGTVVLAASDVGAATTAQGSKADSAVQPGSLKPVATSGSYNDLTGLPTLGSAASQNVSAFATAAQGTRADGAAQTSSLATVATSGKYTDLTARPTLGTAAATDATAYATAAQGTKADAAAPASTISTVGKTGVYADLTSKPTLGTASTYNTGSQGAAVPLANGNNIWDGLNVFAAGVITIGSLDGSSTSACQIRYDAYGRKTTNGGATWSAWMPLI